MEKEATSKQLKYILTMEQWLKTFGVPFEELPKDDIPSLKQASQWISKNKESFAELTKEHDYDELWGALGS